MEPKILGKEEKERNNEEIGSERTTHCKEVKIFEEKTLLEDVEQDINEK